MIPFLSNDNQYTQLWKAIEHDGLVSSDQFKDATKQAKKEGRHIAEILMTNHESLQTKLLHAFSEYYEIPEVHLKNRVIAPYILQMIPKELAEEHSVVIFKKMKDVISVAVTNPESTQTLAFIEKKTGLKPQVYLTTPEDIAFTLKRYQTEIKSEFARIIDDSISESLSLYETPDKLAEHVPIIKIVDSIFDRAVSQRASDIHIEPREDTIYVRFRIDGLLSNIVDLPKELLPALATRIKIMAHLKIDEHRRPQDGRLKFSSMNRDIAMRVSVIPTLHGSKVVLRLLDTKEQQFTLRNLGFNSRDLSVIKGEMVKPHGIILVTGPTGSGKTTTLYSILRMLNKEEVNICTIEDPIEYGLEGVNQTQVSAVAGLTFANGLRSLLRQDPDIIMVGEIRDTETADMAYNAAMTGHLVLSTLHTNNAFLAIQRLVEMGIEPFLTASITNLIIGQRLVRRICAHCKTAYHSTPKVLEDYTAIFAIPDIIRKLQDNKIIDAELPINRLQLFYGKGCERCNGTGYRGRVGIYEVVKMSEALSHVILKNPSQDNVRHQAVQDGTLTMTEDGIMKVLSGITTFEEVLRVTKQ